MAVGTVPTKVASKSPKARYLKELLQMGTWETKDLADMLSKHPYHRKKGGKPYTEDEVTKILKACTWATFDSVDNVWVLTTTREEKAFHTTSGRWWD